MRVSCAGELGWEIHSRVADTAAVWDAVMAAGAPMGLRPFGMFALNSLRIEKGYRAWKGDLSTDYTVLQGGLERFVDWAKPDFVGKAALANNDWPQRIAQGLPLNEFDGTMFVPMATITNELAWRNANGRSALGSS